MRSELFAQEHLEVEGTGQFVRQSSKMMKVELSQGSVVALAGSMVAYQGDVHFEHQGAGGIAKFVKQRLTGEGLPLMRISGTGEIFFANRAADVHVIQLEGESLSINGANILAYEDTLSSDIQMMRGAGMMSGGMFNTTLSGSGQVAILTDGPPLVLDAGEAPTFVDPDAAVCWSAGLHVQLKTAIGMKALLGRTSGEEVQLGFVGQGFVVVQPSENMRFGGQDSGRQVDNQTRSGGGFNLGDLIR
ncbi:AIM24 family protein [Georgenia sp. 10Sc9-8]|uniref:AIM24 family protein n=1 Tax=Georgenia halotolerans TaxID=3028317 RepID=A0ABT5TWE2_9MICO|nr:AIM24 family protein [Georgenia halotolerans]